MKLDEAQELIARNLSAARAKRDLTMKELGQRAGVSTSMISEIENMRTWPSVATMIKLAEGLGVSVFDLLADDGARPQEIAAERNRLAQQLARLEQVITGAAAKVEELTQATTHLRAALLDQEREARGAHLRAHKAEQERDAARAEVERLTSAQRAAEAA